MLRRLDLGKGERKGGGGGERERERERGEGRSDKRGTWYLLSARGFREHACCREMGGPVLAKDARCMKA